MECCSILGVVINCGGGQDGGYIGGQYWVNPGAFNNGFKGFCNILVTAAFSFAGTELVGLAAAETHNPSKALPTAIKQVFWRIAIVSHLFIPLTVVTNQVTSSTLSRLALSVFLYRTPAPSSSVETALTPKPHPSSSPSRTPVSKA